MKKNFASIRLMGLFKYLSKRIALRYLPNLNGITSSLKVFDQEIFINKMDLEQKYFAADCIREPENLIVYKAISQFGLAKCFIDIGANCGHVASAIAPHYESIILFEPNPKLASLLRKIFQKHTNIVIKESAIVDSSLVGNITLNVPELSSGLATLGNTDLSDKYHAMVTYSVKANTLESEICGIAISNAFIKIDVEGFEYEVIKSSIDLIAKERPIVGFEALSFDAAKKCFPLFDRYKFYCARFNFLDNGGALSNSGLNIIKACIFGASIDFIKIESLDESMLENFSQIFSVPIEKSDDFERSIETYIEIHGDLDLRHLKSWSL